MRRVHPLDLDRVEAFLRETGFRFTRPERVVYPATTSRGALLKAHVLDYYLRVADALLPHVAGRPLAFRRYPDGVTGDAFFTKDWADETLPRGVDVVNVWSESRGGIMRYVVPAGAEALAWVAQAGAVEVHPWLSRRGPDAAACATRDGLGSRACGLDRPDVLAFDLDPYVRAARTGVKGREAGGDPGVAREDWERAVEAARVLRDTLRDLRLPAFAKTTGKRGIHVHVPLHPEHPFRVVRAVARTLAEHLVRARPDLFTLAADARARHGRVLVDVGQNGRGQTLAAPYSLRPTREATVATPVMWDELADADPAAFDIDSVPVRLASGTDPWQDLDAHRVHLRDVLHRLDAADA